jgi:hypothetical protein
MRWRTILFSILFIAGAVTGYAASKLDTAKIDAALGRSGSWAAGVYVVDFFRPSLPIILEGVRLAPGDVESFATFDGSGDEAEMMGEVCALQSEVTDAVEKLRAGGVEITGIHNHFLGESPRLMFIHFMAHGDAAALARAFRSGLAATTTPLGHLPTPRQATPAPAWTKSVESALGLHGEYSADYGMLIAAVRHADSPPGPMHDFWDSSSLEFRQVSGGKVATTGDLAVTASELNLALSALTAHGFQIFGVHNHMIDEEPRLLFVHFWKVGAPGEVATGLRAALAVIHTR